MSRLAISSQSVWLDTTTNPVSDCECAAEFHATTAARGQLFLSDGIGNVTLIRENIANTVAIH